ncbi:hypothetical protein J421_4683 (plasmid) [Gemmatirosa kalamazoonensis]|uniref:Uncharacterized protein n=1 Tax=Gemmatirosa kalamazoonensis TaxID=861299 RepID=W0RRM7_9BACT|nr:hypothetical protein [Gemmatirosa kalamazoonensis]AHG92151.1 hypothetical protein J421_4616 [Gemmatirosa kalamazoonensis]AHG92218.1 hypothetical protein J421_4683 [Gemmatirosa kalamazoonensis]
MSPRRQPRPRRDGGLPPLTAIAAELERLRTAPKTGDSVRVILPSGRIVRRRVRGHAHLQMGELSLEVDGHTFASSHATVRLAVDGFRDLLTAREDAGGWYVDARALDA